jgi:hypothetical protein
MSKTCILTIAMGDAYERISRLTHPTIQQYADRIGADFHVIS